MTGVRATKSSELRRGYLDLDTHLAFRRNLRAVRDERRGWLTHLVVTVATGHRTQRRYSVVHVPEPWQAPA